MKNAKESTKDGKVWESTKDGKKTNVLCIVERNLERTVVALDRFRNIKGI